MRQSASVAADKRRLTIRRSPVGLACQLESLQDYQVPLARLASVALASGAGERLRFRDYAIRGSLKFAG